MKIKQALAHSINYIAFFLFVFFVLYTILNVIVEKDLSVHIFVDSFLAILLPAAVGGLLYSCFVNRKREILPVSDGGQELKENILKAAAKMNCYILKESGNETIFCHRSFWRGARFIFDDTLKLTVSTNQFFIDGRSYLVNQLRQHIDPPKRSN